MKEDLKQVEGDAYKTQAKIKELESNVLSLEKDLEKDFQRDTNSLAREDPREDLDRELVEVDLLPMDVKDPRDGQI